jgi:hypothetical protein
LPVRERGEILAALVEAATHPELRLTPSVKSVVARVGEQATASEIAAELLTIHPEYGAGRAREVVLDRKRGRVAPTLEWLADVQKEIIDESIKLHGRVVILGLALLDEDLYQQLESTGLRSALVAEITEPVEELFRRGGGGTAPGESVAQRLATAATADLPAQVDLLGFTPLVSGLRAVLDDPATTLPLAVAVTGKWGAGKSSIMRQLEAQLREPPEGATAHRAWTTVRFDAWKYERSERLWAALAKSVYEQAVAARRGRLARLRFRAVLEWRRLGWWRFLLRFAWPVLAAAAAAAVLAAADLSSGGRAAGALGVIAAVAGGVAHYWRAIADPFKRAVERHASHPDYEAHLGFTSEADRDIACLTATVTPRDDTGLAVFVDDLDRCSSAHLVEVIEAVNQIFNSDERSKGSRCVFVLGLDREMVASSIEAAYGSTVDRLEKAASPMAQDFGFHFIDKLVQLSVSVPRPSRERLQALLAAEPEAATAGHAQLERAREDAQVDAAEIAALTHLELNPRQAKRFHNVFRLQVYVAAAQGVTFGADQTIALARWVALRLRWPALADDLDHDDGLLPLLDAVANEEKSGDLFGEMTPNEKRLMSRYNRWFDDGVVQSVLLTTKEGDAHRVSRLPLDEFLTVA